MERSQGSGAAAERPAATGASDPYQVEHSAHRPLPPEPDSPPARAPTRSTRVELPRGRRICLAVAHDASAARVVRYASKLLVKSRDDTVDLVHVQQKGAQCPKGTGGSGATPSLTPYSSAGGLSLAGSSQLPSQGLGTLRSAPLFAPSPAAPEARPAASSYERHSALPPGPPMSPRYASAGAFSLGSPAGGSLDFGSLGSGGGFRIAAFGGSPAAAAAGQQAQEPCNQLLERCRLQLLAESRRVQAARVTARLLPAGRSPEKSLRNFCKQERCDILVVGCRGHTKQNKLLSLIGQGGGSMAAYCEGHLPDTRVVALPSLHGSS